jgi:hypothetical protein
VLLAHGADDGVVPLADAQQIFAARAHEAVELLVLGGKHDSFADLEQHIGRLVEFLRAAMAPRSDGGPPVQGCSLVPRTSAMDSQDTRVAPKAA